MSIVCHIFCIFAAQMSCEPKWAAYSRRANCGAKIVNLSIDAPFR